MGKITSESQFVVKQFVFLIKLPFLLLMVLFGKRKFEELMMPFEEFKTFFFEPKVTVILLAVNCIVFICELFFFNDFLVELIFQPEDLWNLNVVPIVASWFLHASIAHLFGNMLMLYIFGRIIELHFGSFKMVLIYFGAAITGDIFSAFAGQGGIGASGAIAGLISAAILVKPFYLTYLIMGIPLPIIIVGWLGIFADVSGVLYPTNDGIGHFAHLGGYFVITLLIFLMNQKERDHMKKGLMINILFVALYVGYGMFF